MDNSIWYVYLDNWSVTFCVRNVPTIEVTTDPFHSENFLSPAHLLSIYGISYVIASNREGTTSVSHGR